VTIFLRHSVDQPTVVSIEIDVTDGGDSKAEACIVTIERGTLSILHTATVDHLRLSQRRYTLQRYTHDNNYLSPMKNPQLPLWQTLQ